MFMKKSYFMIENHSTCLAIKISYETQLFGLLNGNGSTG